MTLRVVCAVIIAALIASICLSSSLYTSFFSEDVTERTEEIYGKADTAYRKVVELRQKWDKYSDFAALYMDHSEIEDVTVLIERLNETDTESVYMFRMDCKEIVLIMEHLKESQLPKFNNIF